MTTKATKAITNQTAS